MSTLRWTFDSGGYVRAGLEPSYGEPYEECYVSRRWQVDSRTWDETTVEGKMACEQALRKRLIRALMRVLGLIRDKAYEEAFGWNVDWSRTVVEHKEWRLPIEIDRHQAEQRGEAMSFGPPYPKSWDS